MQCGDLGMLFEPVFEVERRIEPTLPTAFGIVLSWQRRCMGELGWNAVGAC